MIKNTDCSSRESRFDSKLKDKSVPVENWKSVLFITPVLGDPILFSNLHGTRDAYYAHIHMQAKHSYT